MTAIQHTSAHGPRSLAPAPGVTPPEPGGTPHRFLSDALVARGLVSQEQMDAALDASRAGQRYSEILLAEGAISEDDLARTLAGHHRIDHVDLDVFAVEAEAAALVPRATARRLGALPIAILPDGGVVVAVHDPDALTHLGELGRVVRGEIRPVVASRSQVQSRIAEPAPGEAPAAAPATAATPVPFEAHPVAEAPAPIEAPPVIEPPAAFDAAPASEPPAAFDAAPASEPPAAFDAAPVITPALFEPPAPAAAPAPPASGAPSATDTFPGSEPPGEDAPATEPAAGAPDGVTPPAPAPGSRLPEDGGERAADLPDPPGQAAAVGIEGPAAAAVQLEQALLAAERRATAAEERVAAAEREARYAEERVRAAEKHAEGMSAAAHAANDALAQLAQARLVSDRAAQAAATKIENLTGELEAERAARRRLEDELQHRIAAQPAPAPAPVPFPSPAPVVALHAEQPAPPPAPRNLASRDLAPPPPPGPPRLRPVRALAPEPVPATERQRKARGLRRMIAALKRS